MSGTLPSSLLNSFWYLPCWDRHQLAHFLNILCFYGALTKRCEQACHAPWTLITITPIDLCQLYQMKVHVARTLSSIFVLLISSLITTCRGTLAHRFGCSSLHWSRASLRQYSWTSHSPEGQHKSVQLQSMAIQWVLHTLHKATPHLCSGGAPAFLLSMHTAHLLLYCTFRYIC